VTWRAECKRENNISRLRAIQSSNVDEVLLTERQFRKLTFREYLFMLDIPAFCFHDEIAVSLSPTLKVIGYPL